MERMFWTFAALGLAFSLSTTSYSCGYASSTSGFEVSQEQCVKVYRGRHNTLNYDAIAKMDAIRLAEKKLEADRAHQTRLQAEAARQTALIENQTAQLMALQYRSQYYNRSNHTRYYGRFLNYGGRYSNNRHPGYRPHFRPNPAWRQKVRPTQHSRKSPQARAVPHHYSSYSVHSAKGHSGHH